MQVLSLTEHFNISYPVFSVGTLAGGAAYRDPAKLPFSVMNARTFSLSVAYRCDEAMDPEKPSLLIRVRTGPAPDALTTDGHEIYTVPTCPGRENRVDLGALSPLCARFMQIEVENLDPAHPIYDIDVTLTLTA